MMRAALLGWKERSNPSLASKSKKSHNNKIEMKKLGNPLKMNEIILRAAAETLIRFPLFRVWRLKRTFPSKFPLNLFSVTSN